MICNLIFTQKEYPRFAKFSRGYLKEGSIEINRGTTNLSNRRNPREYNYNGSIR